MTASSMCARRDHETSGELAERLVPIATDLVMRVHDEGRDSIARLLESLADVERCALLVVLAAMVPTDAPVADLLAWVTWDEYGRPLPGRRVPPAGHDLRVREVRPCGTHAAYVRHKSRHEVPCTVCADAERAYQRARARRRRAA